MTLFLDAIYILFLLVWLIGTGARIYRQARFYQIEEYMSVRYLRWLMARRDRWLPTRAFAATLIGAIFANTLNEAPDTPLPWLIALIAAIAAVLPPREVEIKKAFRATPRARRLLATAWLLVALVGVAFVQVNTGFPSRLRPLLTIALGFAIFIAAPLLLVTANLLMTPVEAFMRRRFVERARRTLRAVNPTVIGITGSYGKTSTKSYLAHILNGRYRAYPTPKSYNTLMGVCIAINNDIAQDRSIDYFIAEMGAYVPGEIAQICALTEPRISIVVEVGPQHLERFGSLDNIAIAKYEIIKALPKDGAGVFNWDNPYIRAMVERGYPDTRLTVSLTVDPAAVTDGIPRFVASGVSESLDGLHFTVTDTVTRESVTFMTTLLGVHNVTNILLAAATAVHEGMSLQEVAFRVRTLRPADARLTRETTSAGITILNDGYSANPVGIVGALRALSLHQTGRRLLVTPGMVELGELMESENRKLGTIAAAHATDVILVGDKQVAPIRDGLIAAGFPVDRVQTVGTLKEAIAWYQRNLTRGDCVLFLNDLPDTYSV
ncbi:MAG: UDP-N-acetylmuramoyl-tripeptide--D-alanyl-D-alanine ligase [Chloroflexota bacterium]|nr:UDP-N-acetylmuramoyl-tripeptide--D-alanyl-D-alanine ligase [Chloroflexota bacterium]